MPVTRRTIRHMLVRDIGIIVMGMIVMVTQILMMSVIRMFVRMFVVMRMQMNMRTVVAVMAMEYDAMIFARRRTGIEQDAFAIARPVENWQPSAGSEGRLHSASPQAPAHLIDAFGEAICRPQVSR